MEKRISVLIKTRKSMKSKKVSKNHQKDTQIQKSAANRAILAMIFALVVGKTITQTPQPPAQSKDEPFTVQLKWKSLSTQTNRMSFAAPFPLLTSQASFNFHVDFNGFYSFTGVQSFDNGTKTGDWGIPNCDISLSCRKGDQKSIQIGQNNYNSFESSLPVKFLKDQNLDPYSVSFSKFYLLNDKQANSPYNNGYGGMAFGPYAPTFTYINFYMGNAGGFSRLGLKVKADGDTAQAAQMAQGEFHGSELTLYQSLNASEAKPPYVMSSVPSAWILQNLKFTLKNKENNNQTLYDIPAGPVCLVPDANFFISFLNTGNQEGFVNAATKAVCESDTCLSDKDIDNKLTIQAELRALNGGNL